MGSIVRNKLYYTSCKLLQKIDDNTELEETTGYKDVRAYVIEKEEGLVFLKQITLANYKDTDEELVEALEEDYGKKYSAYKFIPI